MNDTLHHEQPTDPDRAFQNLQAHVIVARQMVEDLKKYIETNPPPKYGPELAAISQGLKRISGQFDALVNFPEKAASAISETADKMFQEVRRKLDRTEETLARERRELTDIIGTVRTQDEQKTWLIRTGVGALVVGLILFPLVARVLPVLNGFVAAGIMGGNRWDAGQALMEAGDPATFGKLVEGNRLVTLNKGKIKECREAALKTKKEQSCTIIVPNQ